MNDYVCLFLPFPPSVNNLFVNNRKTGGRFPSKAYKAWQEEAQHAFAKQTATPIPGPVSVTYSFGRPDKRKRDLLNLVKAPEDFIVGVGLIDDDSLVERAVVQWVDDVIGARVEITPATESQGEAA